ncbi:transcriptional regulator, AraC family [Novosphingobium nitrogenifigens DSM 19370]|uniref:Transcriptional regulator, AraC family n=1 Tax=Novosphingobium nitrogenifigens DSM 19370 TaxID=983920 RepID=F1ZCH3_9SPHN|nr:GlxA family transcriptional regulator [Novosphingobium nitrogenifigens]EGD57745.1 transcriptional regulator, AraC family [Novosphingobium nitrogenifigens DSM 19370]
MSAAFAPLEQETYSFYLVPGFSAMAFVAAMEPLRVANRLAQKPVFGWRLFSPDGAAVEASCGLKVAVDGPLDENAATLILCAGFEPRRAINRPLVAALRRMARKGVVLGALDTGAYLLAEAGLIGDAPVTLHWEAVPAFREDYPDVRVTEELFCLGDRLFTCAGGTAAIDMMLERISRRQGPALARAVSEQFIHSRIRSREERQRLDLVTRIGTSDPRLVSVIGRMETEIESPRPLEDLALDVGITRRQMERLFLAQFGLGPAAYYRNLRLERARTFLKETSLPLIEVAVATGFSSKSAMTRAYLQKFGRPPSAERGRWKAPPARLLHPA